MKSDIQFQSWYMRWKKSHKLIRFSKTKRGVSLNICIGLTLKKYGYHPGYLLTYSTMPVVSRCIACKKIRHEHFFVSTFHKRCHLCSNRSRLQQMGENRPCGKDNYFYGRAPSYSYSRQWYLRKDGADICFKSGWELKVATWLDELGLRWDYEPEAFHVNYPFEVDGKWQMVAGTYRPDFFIHEWNKWIEVKGYWQKVSKAKFDAVILQRLLDVELWDGPKLKELGIL